MSRYIRDSRFLAWDIFIFVTSFRDIYDRSNIRRKFSFRDLIARVAGFQFIFSFFVYIFLFSSSNIILPISVFITLSVLTIHRFSIGYDEQLLVRSTKICRATASISIDLP